MSQRRSKFISNSDKLTTKSVAAAFSHSFSGESADKLSKRSRVWKWIKGNLLLILTILAVIIGCAIGFVLRNYDIVRFSDKETIQLIAFPGVIFLQLMKATVLPLIITSLITGLGQINGKDTGRMIGITFSSFAITNCIASATGIICSLLMHPGSHTFDTGNQTAYSKVSTVDTMLDVFRNAFPSNIANAFLQSSKTVYEKETHFNETTNTTIIEEVLTTKMVDGTNALGIVAICIAIGLCLSQMGKKAKLAIEIFVVLERVVSRLINIVVWYSPVGIVSFIVEKILEMEDFWGILKSVGMLTANCAVGIGFHFFVTIPLIYFALTRKNPYAVIKGLFPALVAGFAFQSSGAALPFNLECCEKNLKIPKKITRFVLPVGISLNMNGTAVYLAAATLFVAQLHGIDLSWTQLVLVGIMSVLACIACTVGPAAAVVALIIVLNAMELPLDEISLFFAIDWILRFQAPVNIGVDGFVAAVVHHFSPEMKDDPDEEENPNRSDTLSSLTAESKDTKTTWQEEF